MKRKSKWDNNPYREAIDFDDAIRWTLVGDDPAQDVTPEIYDIIDEAASGGNILEIINAIEDDEEREAMKRDIHVLQQGAAILALRDAMPQYQYFEIDFIDILKDAAINRNEKFVELARDTSKHYRAERGLKNGGVPDWRIDPDRD